MLAARRRLLPALGRRGFFAWSKEVSQLKQELQSLEKSQELKQRSMQELFDAQRAEAAHALQQQSLALLIDADNTSWRGMSLIMAEVATFGSASARRIYGDWTSQRLSTWKQPLADFAITPIQQFTNTTGKNNTDSAMIIDAMDLLHSRRYDVFCLVSSDADFTRLATRIREDGRTVVGIGREMTPRAFVAACDKFVTVEALERMEGKREVQGSYETWKRETASDAARTSSAHEGADRGARTVAHPSELSELQTRQLKLLHDVIVESLDESGWASLSVIGGLMRIRDPSFDPRAFGAAGMAKLLTSELLSIGYELNQHKSDTKVRVRREE